MKNYIIIGLGPHAKRIYYPFLEKYGNEYKVSIRLIVDLKSQSQKIKNYVKGRKIKPKEIFLLKDTKKVILGEHIPTTLLKKLNTICEKENIDGVIISTEPKAHKAYALWALSKNLNILMDKPITAPLNPSTNLKSTQKIYTDYIELLRKKNQSNSKFYIVCQRRNHLGFKIVKDYLKDFIRKFQIPISYIDIYHSDGVWNLPHEFKKENHPYKYGYGKLMHSGYHYIDLFAWIVELNNKILEKKADKGKVYTLKFSPNDFFNQINQADYAKIFGKTIISDFYKNYKTEAYNNYGELDAYILGQLIKDNKVITTASINLQQNSFSRRGWFDLPEDTYKGNGRLRHERINVQVSHFLNIQVHSYQSYEIGKKDVYVDGAGNEDHFDIYIFRNSKIAGGRSFEKITLGETMKKENQNDRYYIGHNEKGREKTLRNFIEGNNDSSELENHNTTNKFLSNIYLSLAKGHQTDNSKVQFNLT